MVKLQNSIRENNVLLVLSEIINNPGLSRARIAENIGLNKATISEIVKRLMHDHYVIETGIGESSSAGGRKPILLEVNKQAGVSISFDIRYDQISYMINSIDGEIIHKESQNIELNKNNICSIISKIVKDYEKGMENTPFGITGIAIAIHGIVHNNKITFTPYYDLDQIDLASVLEQELSIPVYIENEANLSALAESTFDSDYSNLISVSIHTGIGAGVIIDSELYRGFEGRSGEIGHTTLYPNGIECPCGNSGCFEQYCSHKALMKNYRTIKSDKSLEVSDLIEGYYLNDIETVNLLKEFAANLGIGLSNIMGTFCPQVLFINSEILFEIPELFNTIKLQVEKTVSKNIPMRLSALGENASLYGGSILAIQNFLQVDSLDFSFLK
ncbi:ROK family protein [Marinilactibacillus psychrotolerans]|uniref:ROK family protein n=1 Tax=Marinilactibacillus psychrotolerans TaxID=191770 RepID=UPI00388815AF